MTKRGRPPYADILTPAEWRIVEAVRHGMTSREIAARRDISIDAVKYHIANSLQKLGLADRAALRHWNGVARSSALFSKEVDMGETLSIGPVGQIARRVKDIAAARRWYGEVLACPTSILLAILLFLIAAAHVCFCPKTMERNRANPSCISACRTSVARMRVWQRAGSNSPMRPT